MANTTLAVLALSVSTAIAPCASAATLPIRSFIHLHPRVAHVDDRVNLSLYNQSFNFREVKIGGQTYVIRAHTAINVKAPVGTVIYSGSRTPQYRRGDLMLVVDHELNQKQIDLN